MGLGEREERVLVTPDHETGNIDVRKRARVLAIETLKILQRGRKDPPNRSYIAEVTLAVNPHHRFQGQP